MNNIKMMLASHEGDNSIPVAIFFLCGSGVWSRLGLND
jgi:hypothetical protein